MFIAIQSKKQKKCGYLLRQLPTWLMLLSHTRISCIESLCVALPTKHVLQTLKIALAWSKKKKIARWACFLSKAYSTMLAWQFGIIALLRYRPNGDDIFNMEIGCFQSIANRSVYPNQPTIWLTNVYLCQDTPHIHFLIMFTDVSSCNHFSSCNHTWTPFREIVVKLCEWPQSECNPDSNSFSFSVSRSIYWSPGLINED